MRVVLDTNIFISGIFWKGDSYKILDLWRNQEVILIISTEIIMEIIKVLKDFKIQLPQEMTNEWIQIIMHNSIIVEPKEKFSIIIDDPTDNKFIDAAISGKADFIITNDKHLLKIKKFRGTQILTPKTFLTKI